MSSKMMLLGVFLAVFLLPSVLASVTITNPLNTTYPSSPPYLNATTDDAFSWVGYSIDGGANQSFTDELEYFGVYYSPAGSVLQGVEVYGDYLWAQDHDGTLVRRYWKDNMTLIDSFVPRGTIQETYGICHNGTNLFTINRPDREAHMYYLNGTYTYYNFSISGTNDWRSIDCNASSLYVADIYADRIAEYSLSGGFIRNIDVSSQAPEPYGVTFYNDIFYVANRGYQGQKAIYKYYANGTYTGEWTQINETTRVNDVTTDGEYFWIMSELSNRLYKYYYGNFTNIANVTLSVSGEGLHNISVSTDLSDDEVFFTISTSVDCYNCTDCNTKLSSGFIDVSLANNISSSGTCVSMVNNGKTLDCQGYKITSTGSVYPNSAVWVDADNLVVQNCEIVGGYTNVWVDTDADNFSLINNTLHDNLGAGSACVRYKSSIDNGLVQGNEIYNCLDECINADSHGVVLGVTYYDNYFHDSPDGMLITDNNISYNTFTDISGNALILWGTDDSDIVGNNVTGSGYGIWFQSGDVYTTNNISYNYFDNTNNFNSVSVSGSGNIMSYNFWSDYTGWDNTGDGVGNTDIPYIVIAGVFEDNLPLTDNVDIYPPAMSVGSPENTSYIPDVIGVETLDIIINMTASDNVSGLDVCFWSIDGGANLSYSTPTTTSVTGEGQHYVEFYCNDTAENWGYQSAYFTLSYLTVIQGLPIIGLIPFLIGIALLVSVAMPFVSGRKEIDLNKLIIGAVMVMVGLAFIGVLYVV